MKELIILGNGMAGMTAALYAKRANLDFKIVGRDEYDFGQINNAILVENFPCVEPVSGADLAMKLHDQLEGIKIEEHEITKVLKSTLETNPKCYRVEYSDGKYDEAKSIIYALGARHRELDCEIDKDVPIHYCALCDGAFYKDKRVAIIGGGDVAFTQAEYLSKICKCVHILMCDRNVTASPSTFDRVSKIENVKIHYDYTIDKIVKNPQTKGVSIFRKVPDDGNARLLGVGADGIFVAIGMIPNTEQIDNPLGVLNVNYYVSAGDDCSTSSKGFFAAGDVRTKKMRQAITAASDGANAVQSAINYINYYWR
jgi:thioredoxin reductase (NADPH)